MCEVRETLHRYIDGLGIINAERGILLVRHDDYSDLAAAFGMPEEEVNPDTCEMRFRGLRLKVIENPIRRFEWAPFMD
jgi:hypothetical protein